MEKGDRGRKNTRELVAGVLMRIESPDHVSPSCLAPDGIGGAPAAQKSADEIGADFHGSDLAAAVEKYKQALQ